MLAAEKIYMGIVEKKFIEDNKIKIWTKIPVLDVDEYTMERLRRGEAIYLAGERVWFDENEGPYVEVDRLEGVTA